MGKYLNIYVGLVSVWVAVVMSEKFMCISGCLYKNASIGGVWVCTAIAYMREPMPLHVKFKEKELQNIPFYSI